MVRVKKIGVLSFSRLLGIFGLVFGFVFSIIALIVSNFFFSLSDLPGLSSSGVFGGYLGLIVFPISYGIIFFLFGLIFTPVVNIVLRLIKGVYLNMEMHD